MCNSLVANNFANTDQHQSILPKRPFLDLPPGLFVSSRSLIGNPEIYTYRGVCRNHFQITERSLPSRIYFPASLRQFMAAKPCFDICRHCVTSRSAFYKQVGRSHITYVVKIAYLLEAETQRTWLSANWRWQYRKDDPCPRCLPKALKRVHGLWNTTMSRTDYLCFLTENLWIWREMPFYEIEKDMANGDRDKDLPLCSACVWK